MQQIASCDWVNDGNIMALVPNFIAWQLLAASAAWTVCVHHTFALSKQPNKY
jgi:hypothetical protein